MNDQRSLLEQLIDLRQLADKAGLYDAADFIQQAIEEGREDRK